MVGIRVRALLTSCALGALAAQGSAGEAAAQHASPPPVQAQAASGTGKPPSAAIRAAKAKLFFLPAYSV